jgi:hypothetical protein
MKLEFLYTPVNDLQAALALYRDALGWHEAWREGDSTVSLKLPGTEVQLMLDEIQPATGVGPIFVVESVERFHANRPSELGLREEPQEIPGASWPPTRTHRGTRSTSWTSRSTRAAHRLRRAPLRRCDDPRRRRGRGSSRRRAAQPPRRSARALGRPAQGLIWRGLRTRPGGFEPPTRGLEVRCSSTELRALERKGSAAPFRVLLSKRRGTS